MKIVSFSAFIFFFVFALCGWPAGARAATGDEQWDYRFGMPGADDSVLVIATNGTGLYVAGNFRSVAGVPANRVARFDGLRWSALGGGLNSSMVWACAFQGNNVYVGGAFTAAGSVNATNIARWDGTNWYSLGPGLNGTVYALAVVGTNVYAGGMFTGAGGLAVNNVARWDGSSWSAMNGGVTAVGLSAVKVLMTDGTNLYAGGTFNNAGGVPALNLAMWNGNSWAQFNGGVGSTNDSVSGLLFDDSGFYVGGHFNSAGGVAANNIVKWDGNNWQPLGNGLLGSNVFIYTVARREGDLYACGIFTNAGNLTFNNIARWDGNVWTNLAAGITAASPPAIVSGLSAGLDGRLYVGGLFDGAGALGANCLAAWDGNNWASVNAGADNGVFLPAVSVVRAVAVSGNDLYAGGTFQAAGTIKANRIAHWNGTNWSALGSGMHGTNDSLLTAVSALAISGSNVFAGGNFTNAGGITATNIARWDGANWWPLVSGLNGAVSAIAISGSDVYAGGNFTLAGGVNATNIAHWNGSSWSALGTGLNNTVTAIAIGSDGIYAGGAFTTAGGVTVNRVARWDGAAWNSLGSGTTNGVGVNVNVILPVSPTQVYAGGTFTTAGVVAANRVAMFDGVNWSALGSGIAGGSSPSVNALAYDGANLYASGVFTNAGGTMVSSVAKWDGATWTTLGSGLARLAIGGTGPIAGTGTSLVLNGNDLYAGGAFTTAGGKVSSEIAHWNGQTVFAPPAVVRLAQAAVLSGGQFQFRVTASSGVTYVVETSADLTAWQPVVTNSTSPLNVLDANVSGNPQRFYRVRQVQ